MRITSCFTGLLEKSLFKKYGINNIIFGPLISEKEFSRCSLSMESQLGEKISGTLTIQKDFVRPHKFNFDITAVVPASILMANPLVVAIDEVNKEVTLNFRRPLQLVYKWVNNSVGANLLEGILIWQNGTFSVLKLNMDLQFSLNLELHPKVEDIQQRRVLMYLSCIRMNDGLAFSYQDPFTLNMFDIKTNDDIEQFKLQLMKDYLEAYTFLTKKKLMLSQDDINSISYPALFDYLKIQAMHDIA